MYKSIPVSFTVSEELAGRRLDVALGAVLPDSGLRARRRLWSWCNVCVNGKAQPSGYAVKIGDVISVEETEVASSSSSSSSISSSFRVCHDISNHYLPDNNISSSTSFYTKNRAYLLATFEDFLLFYKPRGMHTSVISGKKTLSLESLLPNLWQNQYNKNVPATSLPILLTRLDFLTSGIVIAAKNEEARRRFRQWERHGCVEKTYFSVVEGSITEPFIIKNALDVSKRAKTRVLEEEGEAIRWSHVIPLMVVSNNEWGQLPYAYKDKSFFESATSFGGEAHHDDKATLITIGILCGARHQIRAHLAHVGFPLMGDPLYGQEGFPFLLHHGSLATPEFSYKVLPDWFKEKE